MTDIPKAAIEAAAEFLKWNGSRCHPQVGDAHAVAESTIRTALPHLVGYKESILAAVERILDECSAWISTPNPDVARRIALAAGIAVMTSQSEHHDRVYDVGFAAGQEAMRTDLRLVLASLRWLEECTGETIEGEDATLVRQIEADLDDADLDRHPDDDAVDRFAAAMKAKLAKKRVEGRGGWDDKAQCSRTHLSQLLRDHVRKGDPIDVGAFAMMLHQRSENIVPEVWE